MPELSPCSRGGAGAAVQDLLCLLLRRRASRAAVCRAVVDARAPSFHRVSATATDDCVCKDSAAEAIELDL
jgi:hypothetical protein